jgi:hypothetical protein
MTMTRLDAPGKAFPLTGGHTEADRRTFALFTDASRRVERSPRLRKYRDIIFGDWPEGDDHLIWAATAKVGEIESWAKTIARDVDD